jgi:hypothetical protein
MMAQRTFPSESRARACKMRRSALISPTFGTGWRLVQSGANHYLGSNFLVRQGKYREFDEFSLYDGPSSTRKCNNYSDLAAKFPTQANREFFCSNRLLICGTGKVSSYSGIRDSMPTLPVAPVPEGKSRHPRLSVTIPTRNCDPKISGSGPSR